MHFGAGANKKPQKFRFEYQVFSQKSYLNMGFLKKSKFAYLKFNICIPETQYLQTKSIFRHILIYTAAKWVPI